MVGLTLKKRFRFVLVALIALFIAQVPIVAVAAPEKDSIVLEQARLQVDGEEIALGAPLRIYENRLYVPVAALTSCFEVSLEWDSVNQEVTLTTAQGNTIVLGMGVPVVYYDEGRYMMDAAPFLVDDRTYLPIRYAADLLQAKASWDAEQQVATLTRIEQEEPYVPALLAHEAEPFTEEDLLLLAKITQVEAGHESYEGQLAVANVILNRVKDERFPNTIRDVIYAGKQFPPAHNGLLDKSEPNDSVIRAAKDALNGKNNVEDAVYFHNPRRSGGKFWNSLEVVKDIGAHRFYK